MAVLQKIYRWGDWDLNAEDLKQVHALYQGAVATADAQAGQLLATLQKVAPETIVIVLADHGENLFDVPGRGLGHGDNLIGSHSVQIPFLVYDPVHRFVPHQVPGITRTIDVMPTILNLTGLSHSLQMDGVDLRPLLENKTPTLGLQAFMETGIWFAPSAPDVPVDKRLLYPSITGVLEIADDDDVVLGTAWRDVVIRAKHRAVQTDDFKMIYRPTATGPTYSLYHTKTDPEERQDVSLQYPKQTETLKKQIDAFLKADPRYPIWSK